jgi:hypothetical protein
MCEDRPGDVELRRPPHALVFGIVHLSQVCCAVLALGWARSALPTCSPPCPHSPSSLLRWSLALPSPRPARVTRASFFRAPHAFTMATPCPHALELAAPRPRALEPAASQPAHSRWPCQARARRSCWPPACARSSQPLRAPPRRISIEAIVRRRVLFGDKNMKGVKAKNARVL